MAMLPSMTGQFIKSLFFIGISTQYMHKHFHAFILYENYFKSWIIDITYFYFMQDVLTREKNVYGYTIKNWFFSQFPVMFYSFEFNHFNIWISVAQKDLNPLRFNEELFTS